MDIHMETIAKSCKDAAESNTKTFPEIVGELLEAGFESYAIDFRRQTATYYLPTGESIELTTDQTGTPVAATFDEASLCDAIREAQSLAEGYTYKGSCRKAKAAGCAGYMVSFSGRRVVYYGRTAATHVEYFPR